VGSDCTGLPEQTIHEGGLAVVDVGDDGDVTNVWAKHGAADCHKRTPVATPATDETPSAPSGFVADTQPCDILRRVRIWAR
jgi:hypothetical protein